MVRKEDDIKWLASKLSGATGALGSEAIYLSNWLLCFRCAPEGFRVIIAYLADWMDNSPSHWADYHSLMEFCLVSLYKCPGVHPVGIRETLL